MTEPRPPKEPWQKWQPVINEAKILVMFTIHDHPPDHPDHFVVKRWRIRANIAKLSPAKGRLTTTLDEARQYVTPGKMQLTMPFMISDASIIETWI